MLQKTKKFVIRRKLREAITVKQDERIIFVCDNCRSEQSFELVANKNNNRQTNGEKINELPKIQLSTLNYCLVTYNF